MSELSPQGQALLRATRAALRPQGADKARVLSSLQARLGAPPPTAAPAAAHVSRGVWAAAAAAVVGVGGVVALGLSADPAPTKAPAPVAVVAPAVLPTPSVADVSPPRAPVEEPATPGPAAAAPSAPARRGDRLAEEVAILSQAAKDLRAGRAAAALSALNEHQRRFPSGALTLERRAARAEALCSLGRKPEAQAELGALARSAPQSPLTIRAQERCKVRPTKP
jgi:hypothetical protein